MRNYTVSREQILEEIAAALEPQEYALAMWVGGSAGFGRVDEWSDVDAQVIVKDGFVEQAFEVVEAALAELSEIEYRFRRPEPTRHGHSQCFYSFSDASPYQVLDLLFIQESSESDRFMQFKTHGKPLVSFDKAALIQEEELDIETMLEKMKADLEMDKMKLDLFWVFTTKEINRGNAIEAITYFNTNVLQPLLEVLRITYCPVRHFYITRYVYYDLPEDVVQRLQSLYFVKDLDDLQVKFEQAREWFYQVAEAIDWDVVRGKLEAA